MRRKKDVTELGLLELEFSTFSDKLKKLEVYLQSDESKRESAKSLKLLENQQRCMKVYLEILAERIDLIRYEKTYRV